MSTKIIPYILFGLLVQFCAGQDNGFQFGMLPAVNMNVKLDRGYRLNFKAEGRQVLAQGTEWNSGYELTDLSTILSKKVGINNSLAGGYLFRIRGERHVHRLIQQYNIVSKLNAIRVGHRFVTDQTIETGRTFQLRARYRWSALLPLSGQSIDPTEWYLKLNNEYLNIFQGDYDMEIRLGVSFGFQFNDDSKLEIGLDNRFDSFLDGDLKSRSWLTTSWYLAL